MSQEDINRLANEAEELSVAVGKLNEDMADQVTTLSVVVKRDRKLTKWLAVSVVLDVILSAALGVIAFQAQTALSTAQENRDNAKLTCEVANQTRQAQVQLWEYVLTLSDTNAQNLTAEQKMRRTAQIVAFRAYLAQVFAVRNCEDPKASPPPPPTLPSPK